MELTEAKRLVLEMSPRARVERIALTEALGRVLAEAEAAGRNVPQEPRSRFDGFAISSQDALNASSTAPAFMTLRGETLAAGCFSEHAPIQSGACVRILAGAPLPPNADAVARQEDAVIRENRVALRRPYAAGEGVAPVGGEIAQGELVLARSQVLTPTRLTLLATLGRTEVSVYARPRVALLATGDEVIELGETDGGRPTTYCTCRHLLAWLVRIHGGDPVSLGIASDEAEAVAARIAGADADCIVTTGGIGRGDRDFIRSAWSALGIKTHIDGINLSPGGKSAMGTSGEKLFCALPGNPWGARVAFEELISPALLRSQGLAPDGYPGVKAILGDSVKKRVGEYKAIHGRLDLEASPPVFMPGPAKEASSISAVADNPAYCLLDPGKGEAARGENVRVRFHDFPLLAFPHFIADCRSFSK